MPPKQRSSTAVPILVVILFFAVGLYLGTARQSPAADVSAPEQQQQPAGDGKRVPVGGKNKILAVESDDEKRRQEVLKEINKAPDQHDHATQRQLSVRDNMKAGKNVANAIKEDEHVDGEAVAAKHGIECPSADGPVDGGQIPLAHLPRKKKTSVAQKYDRRANNCGGNGIWNRVTINDHHNILKNIARLSGIKKNDFVLDWGSGCGHSMQFLFDEMSVSGVGIDVSSKTIDYAKGNTTRTNLYCVADGTKMEWLGTSKFDVAYSFGSIYHVYNRTMFCHVIRQLVRIVKVGGSVYNGWTENAEYKRQHIKPCLADLPVDIKIHEEAKEFANVQIFPLKSQQRTPNTYSLVVKKKEEVEDESLFTFDKVPIVCGKHKCVEKNSEEAKGPIP